MSQQTERRSLKFQSLDEVIADVEQLAASEVRVTGQHSFAEIIRHLAIAHETTCGKSQPPKPPLLMRLIMPLMKGFILKGPVKPGFKLPSAAESYFWPADEISVSEAVNRLKESVAYYKENGPLAVHPVFGKVDRNTVDKMILSHNEMHLSFVHPVPSN